MLLCVAFVKAFDPVNWKLLLSLSFYIDICQWISTFHEDIKSTDQLMDNYRRGFPAIDSGPYFTIFIYSVRRNSCQHDAAK